MMDDLTSYRYDDWRTSPTYLQAMAHMQAAEWSQALTVLRALQADFPDVQGVQALIAEVELRLETEKQIRTTGRRLPKISRRVVFVVVLLALIIALGWLASSLYQSVVLPSLAQNQVKQQQDALASQAKKAMTAKDYPQALDLYGQLAALNPSHPALAENPAAAKKELTLAEIYRQAQAQLTAGQTADAQLTLAKLQALQPNYRDVATLLAKLERDQRVTALQQQAAELKAAQDWETAIVRLEELRGLTPRDERSTIEADLYQAYLANGLAWLNRPQAGVGELNHAVDLFNKAVALRPSAPEATTQRTRAKQYLAGSSAYGAGNWKAVIAQLEPLYAEQPDYLGGQAAQLLYSAYMRNGDSLQEAGDLARAWEHYARASQIQGVDATTARVLAARMAAQITPSPTPAPTVLPTPSRTPVPLPPVAAAAGGFAAQPTAILATPTPAYPYGLAEPVRHTTDGCPGSVGLGYLLGQVVSAQGTPLPGVLVRLSDSWGHQADVATKGDAADLGQYNFPLFGAGRIYTTWVVDGAGNALSAPLEVLHAVGANATAVCHWVNWRSGPLTTTPTLSATVIGQAVNIRAGPSIDAQVVGVAPQGAVLAIVGRNAAGDWIRLAGTEERWVAIAVLQISGLPPVVTVEGTK